MSDEFLNGKLFVKPIFLGAKNSPLFFQDAAIFNQETIFSQQMYNASFDSMSENDIQMMNVLDEEQEIAMASAGLEPNDVNLADSSKSVSASENVPQEEPREPSVREQEYDAQMSELTMLYLNKPIEECSYEEINQVYALNMLETNLNGIKEGLQAQSNSDGVVSEAYDLLKYLTGLGVDQKDVEAAIAAQENAIAELKIAIKEGNFEQVYKNVTGVEYDPEKIAQYQQTVTEVQFIEIQIARTQAFYNSLLEPDAQYNPEATLEKFIEFYGEEKGREEFCLALKEMYNNSLDSPYCNPDPREQIQNVRFDDEGNIVFEFDRDQDGKLDENFVELGKVGDISPNLMTRLYSDKYEKQLMNRNLEVFEKDTGLDYEQLVEKYNTLSREVLGDANAVGNLLNEYIASQEGFIDKIAGFTQLAGMALMGVGAVAVFIPGGQALGMGMIKAGQIAAISGTFGDEALELLDTATNNNVLNGEDREKYKEIFKDALTDGALFAAGYVAGSAANSFGNWVLNESGSKVMQFIADHGSDVALSLLGDLAITGEIDLKGEGFSQLLGILTGSAFARINAMHQANFDAADVFYKNGDYDGAYKSLTDKGYTPKDIQKYYGEQEVQRINALYEETGDIKLVLAEAQKSKFLSANQFDNLEISIMLKGLKQTGVDVSKYYGYDFSCPQGKLIADDIRMLYEAQSKGIDIKDLMVPTKPDFETGKIETSVGGVFEADGKLYLKTDENTCVDLNISKDTYCELFPPIDRYSSGQQSSGDCYLVSALNAMMVNPQARAQLLSCFSERIEPDGTKTIILSMPDSDLKIELKEGQTINDLGVESKKHMTGALGMQLLEYGYKKNLEYNEIQKLNAEIEAVENKLLTAWNDDLELWESFGIEDYEDFKTRLASPDYYVDKFEEYIGAEPSKELWRIDGMLSILPQYTPDKMARLNSEGDLTEHGAKLLADYLGITVDQAYGVWDYSLKEYHFMSEHTMPQSYFDAHQKLSMIEIDPQYFEKIAGNGGSSDSVFRAFGIGKTQKVDGKFVDEIIANPEKYKDCVITAGTQHTKADYERDYNDPDHPQYEYWHEHPEAYEEVLKNAPDELPLEGLVSGHAYSFQITTNSKGETVIEVLNPWAAKNGNDQRSIILTVEEFKACFNNIYIGELE